MEITVGAEHSVSVAVDSSNTAMALGSGLVEVFATPAMVALMENAAAQCLARFLPEGQASVGTQVSISHDAATLPGMAVTATAAITAVDRRRVEFHVRALDSAGQIGEGTHTRFIIDVEKFLGKALERAKW